jgi:hypothetical protein
MLNEMERLNFQTYELPAPDEKPSEHSQKIFVLGHNCDNDLKMNDKRSKLHILIKLLINRFENSNL